MEPGMCRVLAMWPSSWLACGSGFWRRGDWSLAATSEGSSGPSVREAARRFRSSPLPGRTLRSP